MALPFGFENHILSHLLAEPLGVHRVHHPEQRDCSRRFVPLQMADHVPTHARVDLVRFLPKNLRSIFGQIRASEPNQLVAGLDPDRFGHGHERHVGGLSLRFLASLIDLLANHSQVFCEAIGV